MTLDIEDKTEQPTARRRREAREQGLGPRSADFSTACRFVGVAAALQFCASNLVVELSRHLTEALQQPGGRELTPASFVSQAWEAIGRMGLAGLGMVGCLWISCLAAHFLQVGLRFNLTDVMPDLSRLSPARGIGKLLRLESACQAGWGLVKFAAVLSFGGWHLWSQLGRLSALTDNDVSTIAQMVGGGLVLLAWQLAALFLTFGLADYGWRYWKFEQSLKMSPAELREELRHESGNPLWKQKR